MKLLSAGLFVCTALTFGCRPGIESRPPVKTKTSGSASFVSYVYRDDSGSEAKYVVFVPKSYRKSKPCPTILFLHGAGQTGDDGESQARGGMAEAIRDASDEYPFLTIFPQSQEGGWLADSTDGRRALAILEEACTRYTVDRSRLYLTGYSMGGEGVWSLASARPELFAAIVPICPGKNEPAVTSIAKLPCWCFQGAADDPRLVGDTRQMMLNLQKAGGRPIYQEYPELGHNCWDAAYRTKALFEWLLQQKKS